MDANTLSISIIVCTFNRSGLLEKLLDSFTQMSIPRLAKFEILVVDNNSTDTTQQTCEKYFGLLPVRYVFEPQQGKCHALNRALKESSSDLLIFTDDDVQVTPDWLISFIDSARQTRFSWFGGRVKPDWKSGAAPWLQKDTEQAFDGYFGNYDLGEYNKPYEKEDKLPLGASLAIRKNVFDDVGIFRTDLGPRGKLRGVGDETDLLYRAIKAGYQGYYIGTAKVRHHVGKERQKLTGFLNYGIGKGINQFRMGTEQQRAGSIKRIMSQALRGLFQLGKNRGDRFRLCLINIGIEIGRLRASREEKA